MSLNLQRRFYGSISIIRCSGLIVVGDSLGKLEQELRHGLTETDRIVLDLRGVDRIDSTGMGLLVRFLSHIRNKGGDLRLCSPTQFVRKLLTATRLDSVFLVYTSDYNAIASFFVRGVPGEDHREFAATVLFLDQSDDLCAFARSVLGQHGYEVLTTTCFSDAQLLARAAQPSVILIGPQLAERENEAVVPALHAAAPNAATVTLPVDFGQSHPHHAAAALLNAVKSRRSDGVSDAGERGPR
jgi:anti-sigma B factor antagonist